ARQEDGAIGKALARLVGIVHRAIDAVAEPELARKMDRETSRAIGEVLRLDLLDDVAVVVVGQHAGDGVLQVEALAEDERWHRARSAFGVLVLRFYGYSSMVPGSMVLWLLVLWLPGDDRTRN